MRRSNLILAAGAAAFLTALPVASSEAAGLHAGLVVKAVPAFELVRFGHRPKAISMYCYPRKYWWFYRPYTTAAEDRARCMPYFKYPRRGFGSDGLK